MSDISRVTLPGEFFDITSSMLLLQPEPQYLYAALAKAALAGELQMASGFRPIGDAGAPYASVEDGRLNLSGPVSTEVFGAKIDFRGKPGSTVKINRPTFTNSTYTEVSRRIPTGSTISTTTQAPTSEQTFITLLRYGGPYLNTAAAIRPYGIDAFDAEMGLHQKSAVVGLHMRRDYDRFLETVIKDLLDEATTAVYPEGMTAVDDATLTGQFPLDYETISRTERVMDDAHLPKFGDGNRLLVVTPTGKKQLKDDPQFAHYAEAHKEISPMFPGYFATVSGFHCCVNSMLAQTDNSSSVEVHYGHAVAPGALGIGMGRPPRVRNSTDDNYGESQKLIWIGDHGFKLLDETFVVSVRHTEDTQN